jgi:hypothetical protein
MLDRDTLVDQFDNKRADGFMDSAPKTITNNQGNPSAILFWWNAVFE